METNYSVCFLFAAGPPPVGRRSAPVGRWSPVGCRSPVGAGRSLHVLQREDRVLRRAAAQVGHDVVGHALDAARRVDGNDGGVVEAGDGVDLGGAMEMEAMMEMEALMEDSDVQDVIEMLLES